MPWTAIEPSADPQRVIGTFLAAGAEIAPEPVYLAWLLSLEVEHDPAEAAAVVLAALPATRVRPPAAARLAALLADTTRWPRAAVAALVAERRRGARAT